MRCCDFESNSIISLGRPLEVANFSVLFKDKYTFTPLEVLQVVLCGVKNTEHSKVTYTD